MSFDKQHEVTQADRDAAAELFARFTAYSDREERAGVFRRGEMDDSEFALSFVKHRLAALEASSRQEERLSEQCAQIADVGEAHLAAMWEATFKLRETLRLQLEPGSEALRDEYAQANAIHYMLGNRNNVSFAIRALPVLGVGR